MALLDCKFFSETLGMSSSMQVILPEAILKLRQQRVYEKTGPSGSNTTSCDARRDHEEFAL